MSNYKGNNNKGGKRTKPTRTRNQKQKSNPRIDKFDSETATNDPRWYGADPALLRDSASLPFSWAVGTPISLHNPALDALPSGQEFTIPGICALRVVPSIGWTDSPSDPINTAAFSIYSFVRHQNSGHANYDAPDLMIYLLAMSQVYSYINYLQRAYGLVTTYAQKNRYLPDHVLESMGINASDVRYNLANFRYGINALINKAASLCVPATMPIFSRYASMYQNIYIEGGTLKDQIYHYTPAGFWKYTLNSDSAGMLEYHPLNNNLGVSDLITYGNDMLARLIQSEDMNIMSGDILKAYGDGALIKLSPLGLDYPIIPLPDLAVLQQMKNATVVPDVWGADVVQDSTHGWLEYKPRFGYVFEDRDDYYARACTYLLSTYCEDRVLTVSSNDPTPEEIMETTRSMFIANGFDRAGDGLSAYVDLRGGADIIVGAQYYYVDVKNGVSQLKHVSLHYLSAADITNGAEVSLALKQQSIISNFKFHPAHHFIMFRPGETDGSFQIAEAHLSYDVNNYTIVSQQVLEKMHEAALLSMLNVPSKIKL